MKSSPSLAEKQHLTVASKAFSESNLLAEIMAQLIEHNLDVEVTRKMGLGGTMVVFGALKSGEIDLYPEYTGTGLTAILKHDVLYDKDEVFRVVQENFLKQFRLKWLSPFGFNNTYAIAVSQEFAKVHSLSRLSDLARVSSIRFGLGHEFLNRPDGYPGLAKTYGFRGDAPRGIEHALAYQGIADNIIDAMDAYSTDGKLQKYHLQVLEDDKHYFPPYHAAPVVRVDTLQRIPGLQPLLEKLANRIDDDLMQSLNYKVEEQGLSFAQVAQNFLVSQHLIEVEDKIVLPKRSDNFFSYAWNRKAKLASRVKEHLTLTLSSVLLAILFGVPIGLLISRSPKKAHLIIAVAGTIQTIPSLALLAFLLSLPFFGLGARTAIFALLLYALLPIIRNTYTGISSVPPQTVEAARAMGMSPLQIMWHVELPMSVTTIMAGIRTSAVINIGIATIAAFIGAGGLGEPIVTGLYLNDSNLILFGAIPAAFLALCVDFGLHKIEHAFTSKGLT